MQNTIHILLLMFVVAQAGDIEDAFKSLCEAQSGSGSLQKGAEEVVTLCKGGDAMVSKEIKKVIGSLGQSGLCDGKVNPDQTQKFIDGAGEHLTDLCSTIKPNEGDIEDAFKSLCEAQSGSGSLQKGAEEVVTLCKGGDAKVSKEIKKVIGSLGQSGLCNGKVNPDQTQKFIDGARGALTKLCSTIKPNEGDIEDAFKSLCEAQSGSGSLQKGAEEVVTLCKGGDAKVSQEIKKVIGSLGQSGLCDGKVNPDQTQKFIDGAGGHLTDLCSSRKFSENEILVDNSSGTNMVLLGTGFFLGMGMLLVVQAMQRRMRSARAQELEDTENDLE